MLNTAVFGRKIGAGMIIAWIDPGKEPTRHLLADLRQKKTEFGNWQGTITLVISSAEQLQSFVKSEQASLPKNISCVLQSDFPVKLSELNLKPGGAKNLPVVLLVNSKGVIRYLSEGYRIGIGDDLLTLIK